MKRASKHDFPRGWNEKKVRAVIAHYEQQTEEEAALEIETAPEAAGKTWLAVPTELVADVARLIEDHERRAASVRSRNHRKKTQLSQARR